MPMATVHAMNLKCWVAPTIRLATTAARPPRMMARAQQTTNAAFAVEMALPLVRAIVKATYPNLATHAKAIVSRTAMVTAFATRLKCQAARTKRPATSPRMPPMRTARVNTLLRVRIALETAWPTTMATAFATMQRRPVVPQSQRRTTTLLLRMMMDRARGQKACSLASAMI